MSTGIKVLIEKYRELILYCLIGCMGAGIDFLIFSVLIHYIGLYYQLANFISVSFGIVNNFFFNYLFNFRTKDKLVVRLMSFYAVGMFGWALSAACLFLFIEQMEINAMFAKLATIFLVTVVQFLLNKYVTFRRSAMKAADQGSSENGGRNE